MNTLDTIYRAFADYRKVSSDSHDCAMQRSAVARADANKDLVETVRYTCKIDEDWVEAIEKGMVFVEKAIAEERQFIRNNGEVVPIEKVKRVSRDSVEHLSRHSDLITKEPPEGQDVIPDQLYTVERLSDYAVYENRFLYMLLRYLEQFISLRYNKIVELANTYRGKLSVDKKVKSGRQNLTFKVELNEERRNDPLLSELNPNKSVIERIAMLLKMVTHYLSVPLMQEVSKSPLLKPPITKTNVLKMNNNFKGAVALYEFVSSYDKPGYTAEKQVKKIGPFPDVPADEFAEVEALASYLTYQYGMGVKDILRNVYLEEEERRRKEEERKHLEQLEALRRRIAESGESPEEYMLLLEKRNRVLEADSAQLAVAKGEIDKLTEELKIRTQNLAEQTQLACDRLAEVRRLEIKYAEDMSNIKAEHARATAAMEEKHNAEVADMRERHAAETEEMRAAHEAECDELKAANERSIEELNDAHRIAVENLNDIHRDELAGKDRIIAEKDEQSEQTRAACEEEKERVRAACREEVAKHEAAVREKDEKIADVTEENRLLGELKTLSDARLNAMRYEHGLVGDVDDYTSEQAFDELERQHQAFSTFFKRTWRRTKRKIRRELLRNGGAQESAEQQTENAEPPQESVITTKEKAGNSQSDTADISEEKTEAVNDTAETKVTERNEIDGTDNEQN